MRRIRSGLARRRMQDVGSEAARQVVASLGEGRNFAEDKDTSIRASMRGGRVSTVEANVTHPREDGTYEDYHAWVRLDGQGTVNNIQVSRNETRDGEGGWRL